MRKSEIYVTKQGVYTVVRPVGRLGLLEAEDLSATLEAVLRGGERYIATDMQDVDFISSTCLGVLVQTHHEVQRRKGRLVVGMLNPEVRRIFEISRLDQLLDLESDLPGLLQTSERLMERVEALRPLTPGDDEADNEHGS